MQKEQLIIIGSGPAGLTAATYASRAGLQPLVIDGKKPGGQLIGTTAVENWPGEKSILGPTLMQNMREHAKHFGTRFLSGTVTSVNLQENPFVLTTNKNQTLSTHALIIATGATPRTLGCPGEEKYWGKGVTTCAVCDGAFYKNQPVVIVGGGDTAMEDASFMRNFTDDITIVQIEEQLTASQAMQEKVVHDNAIKIIYQSIVTHIQGNAKEITHIGIKSLVTNEEKLLPAKALFVAIGLTPNTAIFKGQLELTPYGHIVPYNHIETSIEGVYTAGDVADPRYRQAITSAGTGCMAALQAEKYLKKPVSGLK